MIYFFYPSKIMGGAEYLMINSANLLANSGLNVGVIDIEEGWIINNIQNDLIKKEVIAYGNKFQLKDEDVLVTTANNLYKLDDFFLKSNARVLFWVVQPYNVVLSLPKILDKNKFIKSIGLFYISKKLQTHKENLQFLIKKNGIVSMDGECDRILKIKYNLNYKKFLPIFIENNKFFKNNISRINNKALKIVWLGRIDLEFKIHILKKVLFDLNEIKRKLNYNFIFNIIGNGPGIEELEKFTKNIDFEINFLNELKGDNLSLVLERSDLGFAMGTSALEIAAKKVPVVLLDFSYKKVTKYNYRWIFETNEYILGRDINLLSKEDISSMKSIECILNELNQTCLDLPQLCYDYVYENHSSKSIFQKMIKYISDTDLTIADIYEYRFTKPIWNKISYYLMKLRK
ncbi:TPA: hypothetical protein U9I82_002879 [Acinetobacter baumannii]|nr:hypothetical protein [Acinetobacter baumannii]HEN9532277.1 hypothetical protein [Acinetobacter baumannii]HEO0817147.1 hypothetical protein [Acinetobacter baumannii]